MGAVTYIGTLFANPYMKPLSTAAQFQQCYLRFYLANTTTLATVYRDAGLLWPYNQTSIPGSGPDGSATLYGVPSDAAGRFDPIYLNPNVSYFYQLYSASGTLLETNATSVQYGSLYQRLVAVKYGSTSRCNTTTVVNDPALQINIPAVSGGGIKTYRIEADLQFYSESGSQALEFEIAYSGAYAGAAPIFLFYGLFANAYEQNIVGLNTPGQVTVSANQIQNVFKLIGNIQCGSAGANNGGTLSIKWAQNAATTTPLICAAGSALYATLL